MGIPIFLSRAEPHTQQQNGFLHHLCTHLRARGLDPRTVGNTDYALGGLEAVRALVMQSNGLLSVAFRRIEVRDAEDRPDADPALGRVQQLEIPSGTWFTTPWCHMETAMAFQLGLPIVVLVEKDVRLDGTLEAGVLVQHPPEFDVTRISSTLEDYFDSPAKWQQLAATWEGQVREVLRNRSRPPVLFGS